MLAAGLAGSSTDASKDGLLSREDPEVTGTRTQASECFIFITELGGIYQKWESRQDRTARDIGGFTLDKRLRKRYPPRHDYVSGTGVMSRKNG